MLTDVIIMQRLILATMLGGIIGMEREMHGRAAGWRTHILVCLGSCLIMLVNFYIFETFRGLNSDPTRIAAQVISGIGFLGAGTILRSRASVRGLTTAASLWASAGIGLAVGCGFYHGAIMTTLLVLITLYVFTKIERHIIQRSFFRVLFVRSEGEISILSNIRKILRENRAEIMDFEVQKKDGERGVDIEFEISILDLKYLDTIIAAVTSIKGVTDAKWVTE